MAIEYGFLDRDDEALIATSELPVQDGIAVAVRTTGYEVGEDEIVQLAIVDLSGAELFSHTVKPQNVDEWEPGQASGGLSPADVADAPELYQFEDEIMQLFENASTVVGQHVGFITQMIEASWVALPPHEEFDLSEEFCASHCAKDYPGEPAVVVSMDGMAGYYGVEAPPADDALAEARAVAACYVKLVEEHAREREAKGPEHWERYRKRCEEAELNDEALQRRRRNEAARVAGVNAILWLCAAAIFGNLAVQLYVRGMDFGIVAICAAAGVFTLVRWVMALRKMLVLRK